MARQTVDRLPAGLRRCFPPSAGGGRGTAAGGGYFSHGFKLNQTMRGLDERARRHQR